MHTHRMRRPASGPERKLIGCPIVDAVSTPSTPSASCIAAFCLFAKRRQSQIETDVTHARRRPRPSWDTPLPSSGLSRVNPECVMGPNSAACLCCRQSDWALRSGVVIGASSRLQILLIKLRKFTTKSIYYHLSISPHYRYAQSKRTNHLAHRKFSHPQHHLSTKELQLASRPWLPPVDSPPHRP